VDLKSLSLPVLVFDLIIYGCLPLWLVMGFLDYLCHRRSHIELNSGVKESLFHAVMGLQIGVPIFLGLYFHINVLILLIIFGALLFHVLVAHCDVAYAKNMRNISMLEMHVHSVMETLPFFTVALLVCINWGAFVDLITLHWAGNLQLVFKSQVDQIFIAGYVALLLIADVIPYIEEFFRCARANRSARADAGAMISAKGD
jgi:hypothetical protein